jgi:hypothetical protein
MLFSSLLNFTMNKKLYMYIAIGIVGTAGIFLFLQQRDSFDIPRGTPVPLEELDMPKDTKEVSNQENSMVSEKTGREIFVTDGVRHSIPTEEIRQGCFGRDCIPSVDNPSFVSIQDADTLFTREGEEYDAVIGMGLVFNGEERFYPFNMLVTREIVNDVVGGQPLVVTYCPLCGTGIVFNREFNGKVFEFGVSGMLWQSNLLMYNREEKEEDISLWSQVLGEAVVGTHTGTKLSIVPSDVVRYSDWRVSHPSSEVLDTGQIGDPYNGNYYGVAKQFRPNFDEASSVIDPTAYVFGIEVDGKFKAYVRDSLQIGTTNDTFAGYDIAIEKKKDGVVRIFKDGESTPVPIVTGFWFSWVAAHPETELYKN